MAATPPPQVLQWKYLPVRIVEARAKSPLMCIMTTSLKRPINYGNNDGDFKHSFLILPVLRLSRSFVCQGGLFSANYSKFRKKFRLKKYAGSLHEVLKRSEKIRRLVFVFVAGLMFVMSASLSVSGTPSRQSGTQGAFTGVGLSIGYPTKLDGSAAGFVVISASPGGPANRAGMLSGDVILAIDDTSTETMGIYDAAELLQ